MPEIFEVVDRTSPYDALRRGELDGTDLRLVFVEEEVLSEDNNIDQRKNRLEIDVHRYCFLSSPCDLIRAALEKSHQFQELQRGAIEITVPPGTFLAVPHLLRWYYDHRISFKDALEVGDVLPALWKLGDFMNATELCEALEIFLEEAPLRSGHAFARLIHHALVLETKKVIDAVLTGLPVLSYEREKLEAWLDFGSSDLLHALVACKTHWDLPEDHDKFIIAILGEYLAEMTTEHLHQMPPTMFARALARMKPGTIAESDLARMVLGYIESKIDSFDDDGDEVQALLMAIDFSAISKDALRCDFLPRVERLSWSLAITINDLLDTAGPVATRCAYSAMLFLPEDFGSILELPCRHLISKESFFQARKMPWPRRLKKFRCPYCFHHSVSARDGDEVCGAVGRDLHIKLVTYHRNKGLRSEALNRWADAWDDRKVDSSSDEDDTLVSVEESRVLARRKRRRKQSHAPALFPVATFLGAVRILDQCSPLGCDRIYVARVIPTETPRKVINEFTEMALGPSAAMGPIRLVNKEGVLDGFDLEASWEGNGISLARDSAGGNQDYDLIIRRYASG